ncbi:MAG: M20/M25/M40 family metallo-hydrolase, partial [Myxococcota bacterium]
MRMVFANMWLFEPLVVNILSKKGSTNATLRTTTAATIFRGGLKDNLLPKRAEAVVNFRIIPGETPESVKSRVESVIDDDRVLVEYHAEDGGSSIAHPTRVSSTEAEGFVALSETIRQVAQDAELVVAPYLVLGVTDARHFESITDNAYRFSFNRFGPEDLDRLHGNNERISVENYAESIRFYALFLQKVAR